MNTIEKRKRVEELMEEANTLKTQISNEERDCNHEYGETFFDPRKSQTGWSRAIPTTESIIILSQNNKAPSKRTNGVAFASIADTSNKPVKPKSLKPSPISVDLCSWMVKSKWMLA